jgi:hypothetical protein
LVRDFLAQLQHSFNPLAVFSSTSAEGRQRPAWPKTAMADPPKRNTDFSSPR